MDPYYRDDYATLYHADYRAAWPPAGRPGCVIFDPPWDSEAIETFERPESDSLLVFTDARRLGQAVERFGGPTWVFTWNTLSPWNTSPRRPVQQTKHCLWYGDIDLYDRDGVLWGDAPDSKKTPTTIFEAETGRRLTDLWGQSLRWLHNPKANSGKAGRRFDRKGNEAHKHAKPLGWITCLIGNTTPGGPVVDPFAGTGTALRAAKDLYMTSIGYEIDEKTCEIAADRLRQNLLPFDQ